ncbi:MAG: septation protein A, partial [Betaproteobacteria bacterium]|nr:septation protein A [Betaproteobacteria bacterium]
TLVQIGWLYFKHGKVEPMQWMSLGIITIFGGATLLTHNDTFIKWKPTILFWLMGAILIGGQLLLKKNFIKSLMSAQLNLPDPVWQKLLWSWAVFFLAKGGLNLWVAFHFDTDTWVNYKLFGSMGLMLLFVLGQGVYLSRHIQPDNEPAPTPPDSKTPSQP